MWKIINSNAAYYGLIATGILILIFIIYLIYAVFAVKIKLSPKSILTLLLLTIIAVGIHSLQHQGQAIETR
jgi:hypothetical protein